MPFVKVASVAAVPAGSMVHAEIGDEMYLVCNVDGELHAMDGRCPHAGGPLGEGNLRGHTVVCPWHSWEFDCRSGETDFNARFRLKTFSVKADGDDVLVNID